MLKLSGLTIRREFHSVGPHQYLAALAGLVKQQSPQTGPLSPLGAVDLITRDRVAGLGRSTLNNPGAPVLVEILNGDEPLVRKVRRERAPPGCGGRRIWHTVIMDLTFDYPGRVPQPNAANSRSAGVRQSADQIAPIR